jgi:hypothetical protein
MNKKLFFSVMLAIALVFGMTVVGCDSSGGGGDDPSGLSGGSKNSDLIGKWWLTPEPSDIVPVPVFEFKANGKMYFSGEADAEFDYSATVNKITLLPAGYGLGDANYSIYNDPTDGLTMTMTNCTGLFIGKEATPYYKREGGSGGPGGGLAAPTGLTTTAISSNMIQISWNVVTGAAKYNVYNSRSSSSGFALVGNTTTSSAINNDLPANTTFYYQVAAVAANGTEGARSSVVSATTLSAGSNYSLNGVWWSDYGEKITVNGSTGIINEFGELNPLGEDAVRRNYLKLGDLKWQNLTSTGNLIWSGQTKHITYNTSNPNVATGTRWRDCTITMSTDGQTITFESADSDGPYSYTYTRIYVPPASGITSVYIAGSYEINGNNIYQPCYWVNGVRTELEVPVGRSGSATGIAVSGNTVYVSGAYETNTGTAAPCYWVNGQRTDLQLLDDVTYYETRAIAVLGDTVYVAGQYRYGSNNSNRRACYWVNGTGNNLTVPSGRNADTIGVYVEGTTVYMLGVHGPTDDTRVCYWGLDGVLVGSGGACDLPSGSGSNNYYNTPGAMLKTPDTTSIYLPGNVMISNVQRACYWRNGYRTDLPVPSGTTYSTNFSIAIAGSTVYAVGRYETGSNQTACYWKDGTTRTDLPVAGASISRAGDIYVLGTTVYVAGSYGNSVENRKACYWTNGTKTDLSVPTGATFSNAGVIVVVEQ